MKKYSLLLISLLAVLNFLSGCRLKERPDKNTFGPGTPVPLSYAKGFQITDHTDFTEITVSNPWKPGELLDRYYLVKEDSVQTPDNGRRIRIPVETLMANSATYFGFLELLGELDKVVGIGKAQYIYNPTILQGVRDGKIKELGESFSLDIEKLILLQPQIVMTTVYNAEDENTRKMRQSGLNLVYNTEWMEPSILGRAEWIKYVGAFFDKSTLADSLFNTIVQEYHRAQETAAQSQYNPTIFSGQDYRGTWSMPGGKSYTAELFKDARTSYHFASDTTATSIPGTTEQALMLFSDADIWIGAQASTYQELEATSSKYGLFKAFRDRQVWNTAKRSNRQGGNDFWEMGVARPDLLLKDMIKIAHPELLPDYETTYFERLK